MPWWGWIVIATLLGAGLNLLIQWARVRLRDHAGPYPLIACPHCEAMIPLATWRCWRCRRWVRRRGTARVLGVLQIPAFIGGAVLLVPLLVISGLVWLLLKGAGRRASRDPLRRWTITFHRLRRALLGPPARWYGPRERQAYWWTGATELTQYRIPLTGGSAAARIGEMLERAIGRRDLPGAWRGAVLWLREPDAVIRDDFLAGTHLTEIGSTSTWVNRGTFHRVDLAPLRDWVGWRGTRQDLEALGDRYLSIAGGTGLVAVGTGNDRPPPTWGPGPGEAPPAWVSVATTHGDRGWEVNVHWNLWYPPEPIPESLATPVIQSSEPLSPGSGDRG